MGNVQKHPWAPADPRRWPAGCTPTARGWVRWYKGASRWVASKSVPLADVEDKWIAKKRAIDKQESAPLPTALLYRDVLALFLAAQKARIGARNQPIAERTYANYVSELNRFGEFMVGGRSIASLPIGQIGPEEFSAYAQAHRHYGGAAFDSLVVRVSALFRWAADMEYIDRFRPGPTFIRPHKGRIRHERINLQKCFAPDEIMALLDAANNSMRLWIMLGLSCAMTNSDIAHLPRECIDWDNAVIDFRRRKTGAVRRIMPLPAGVLVAMKAHCRADPVNPAHDEFFFLSEYGLPLERARSRNGRWMPANTVSHLFGRLQKQAGVHRLRRSFTGLRTTFYNLCPPDRWEIERKIIMGRAHGTIDLDHYLERVGLEKLRELSDHVWSKAQQVTSE